MFSIFSASAAAKPSPRFASAIVADRGPGYHDIKIDTCSLDADHVPTGEFLLTDPFTTGGHRWRIRCYPHGTVKETAGFISLFLVLDETVAKPVRARFEFTVMVECSALFFLKWEMKLLSGSSDGARSFASHGAWRHSAFARTGILARMMGHGKLDHSAIRCEIVVDDGFHVEVEAPPPTGALVSVPPPDLHKHLGDLLQTGRGADVVFEVGGETFAAHRCVLAAWSTVFSAERLGAATKDQSDDIAAPARVVSVHGMEPHVFRALLRFAYTDLLPEMNEEDEDAMYRDLLAAADRYKLQRLKLICEDKLCKRVDGDTVATMSAQAGHHHCDGMKKACIDFLSAPANPGAVVGTRGQ